MITCLISTKESVVVADNSTNLYHLKKFKSQKNEPGNQAQNPSIVENNTYSQVNTDTLKRSGTLKVLEYRTNLFLFLQNASENIMENSELMRLMVLSI